MVSCIAVETASFVFACLSLFSSCMGSLVSIIMMAYMDVLVGYLLKTVPRQANNINELELGITYYGLYCNVGLGCTLSIMVVSLIFTIILTKGLLSKKAHLVKAYFIYGVTTNSISILTAFLTILFYNVVVGLLSLLGCFLYAIILIIIMRTYQKLKTADIDQYSHKKLKLELKMENQTA